MKPFLNAYASKEKHDQNKINLMSWLIGIYSTQAIAACFGKNNEYPSLPIDLDASENAEKKAIIDAQKFEAYAIAFNHEFNKRNSQE